MAMRTGSSSFFGDLSVREIYGLKGNTSLSLSRSFARSLYNLIIVQSFLSSLKGVQNMRLLVWSWRAWKWGVVCGAPWQLHPSSFSFLLQGLYLDPNILIKMLFVLAFLMIHHTDFIRLQKVLTFLRCPTRMALLVSTTLEGISPLSHPTERKQVNKNKVSIEAKKSESWYEFFNLIYFPYCFSQTKLKSVNGLLITMLYLICAG